MWVKLYKEKKNNRLKLGNQRVINIKKVVNNLIVNMCKCKQRGKIFFKLKF